MSVQPPNKKQNRRKRNKKRRTEDFSSDSDSSSSDSESGNVSVTMADVEPEIAPVAEDEMTLEAASDVELSDLEPETQSQLSKVTLTKTDLTLNRPNVDLGKIAQTLDEKSADLKNEFLGLVFNNFDKDIDELRKAPDFNQKSLVLLANVLKQGSDMFDLESFKAIVEK